jgi:hypothetical protein
MSDEKKMMVGSTLKAKNAPVLATVPAMGSMGAMPGSPAPTGHVVHHQVAEQEAGARLREAEQRDDHAVDPREERLARRRLQDQQREEQLQAHAPRHQAPRDHRPVHAEQPGYAQQHDHAQHRYQPLVQRRVHLADPARASRRAGRLRRGRSSGCSGDSESIAGCALPPPLAGDAPT